MSAQADEEVDGPVAPDLGTLGAALDAIPLGVVLLDPAGRPVWSNRVVRVLAAEDAEGLARLVATVAEAASPSATTVHGVVSARLPTDRGLLDREVRVDAVGVGLVPGFRVATFDPGQPSRAIADEPARRLEAMLEHTDDLVTLLDADGTIRFSNAAAGRLTGLSGGTANGRSALTFVHPDDAERAAVAFAEALASPGLHPKVDLRLHFADGTWHDVQATANNLLDDPSVEGLVITMHDVTDRKAAELEAQRGHDRLRSLVENLSDVVVVLDERFEVTYSTPALATIIEAPVESNLGMSAFNDIHPHDVAMVVERLTDLAAKPPGETIVVELRLEARPRSGRWKWIRATAVNRLADPNVAGIVCTLRDVTSDKASAEELQAAYDRVRATAEQLRELDALKDQFLASVSHEMRTPLSIIVGFADLLERGPQVQPDVHAEAVTRIRSSASDMRTMVENLLDFSALEAGRLPISPRTVPLRAMLEAVAGTVRSTLEDHPLTIDVAEELRVVADADGLDRTIRNLLANAAKYSDRGKPVTVRARREGDVVHVDFTDEGIGIPADQLGLVFERLYRAPGAAFAGRGTGIGLNMVRRYAQLMGGSVAVRSVVGEGSTFTVTLPAALDAD